MTAVGVVVAGLQGSVFGYLILKKVGIKQQEAVGLSVGAVSHALGTVVVWKPIQKRVVIVRFLWYFAVL